MKVTELTRALLAERRAQRGIIHRREGMKFHASLPGDDWKLATFNGNLIAASPEHGVYIVTNDGIEPIKPSANTMPSING